MVKRSDTYDLVFQAAYALLGEGIKPSVDKVRERTQTGSTKTINDALNAFWLEIGQRLNRPDLPPPLVEAVSQLWQVALDQADQALASYRRAAEEKVAMAEAERDGALAEQRAQAAEAEDLRRAVAEHVEQKTTLDRALTAEKTRREQAEAAIAQAQREAAQARDASADAKAAFLQELEREQQRADATEQRLVAQYDEQKTARQRLERELERELERREQAHRAWVEDLQGQIQVLKTQLEQQGATLAEREAALQGALAAQHELTVEQTARHAAYEALQAEHERLTRRGTELQQATEQCTTQLAEADQRRQAAELDAARAAEQSAGLEREKASLERQLEMLLARFPKRSTKPPARGEGRGRGG